MLNGAFRGGSSIWSKGDLGGSFVNRSSGSDFGGKLGFLREYLATVGGKRVPIPKASYLSDFNYALLNPRMRRFFCSEAPKKKSKTFVKDSVIILIVMKGSILLIFFFLCGLLMTEYENFYPKQKKENPKKTGEKSDSKGLYFTLHCL